MWILYVIAFIIGASLYLAYLSIAIPAAAAAACVLYAVGLPTAYVTGLGKVLATRPEELPAPRHWPKPPAKGDPALLQYFYGPARADADHAARVAYDNCQQLWNKGLDLIKESFDQDDAAHERLRSHPPAGRRGLGRPGARPGSGAARRRLGPAQGEERPDGVPALLRARTLPRL